MNKIVIASNNAGKLREFAQLLVPFAFEAIPQAALGISEAEEPHATFVENALAKARHASRAAGLPALADDSGICVLALGGAPGVLSARYASLDNALDSALDNSLDRALANSAPTSGASNDARNNEKLIRELADKADRRAFYYCSLVMVMHADDPQPLIADGRAWGEIVTMPRGSGGFGYDPYFLLPALGKTMAELTDEDKHAISHRGRAMQELAAKLKAQQAFSA